MLDEDFGFYLFSYEKKDGTGTAIMDVLPCDYNFQNVYRFRLLHGKFFSEESFSENSRKVILNEKAVQLLGMKDCIGKTINREGVNYEITGVVRDFHYTSKQKEIPALAIVQIPDADEYWSPSYCSVLIQGNDMQNAVNSIKKVWKEIAPGIEFNYSFFSQDYDKLYRHEMQTKKVFIVFSLIALSLSCLGLFGFVNYLVQNRTKEIGIRKVNGARSESIFLMLSRYFTMPVTIAMAVASPVAYFGIHLWLKSFAYKIDISVIYFLLAGGITLFIVFVTVGWLSWKASSRNPVEALRYE